MDNHLLQLSFTRSTSEATLYVKTDTNQILVVSLYVDDMLITGSDPKLIQQFKDEMQKVLEMTNLGLMQYFLGMEVKQYNNGIFICQQKYASDILKKFNMEDCKPMSIPMVTCEKLSNDSDAKKADEGLYRSLIGSLLYLTATRPNIMFAVSILSRYMHSLSEKHFAAGKRILRYLKKTITFGVLYTSSEDEEGKLIGYSDSDWGGCVDDLKNTSGNLFTLGSSIYTWNSKKQETTAQSTVEAEYIAAASVVNQAIWLRKLLLDLGYEQKKPTEIKCDNLSAISTSKIQCSMGKLNILKSNFTLLGKSNKLMK